MIGTDENRAVLHLSLIHIWLPLNLQKRKTEHFTASANDAFAVIRITARDNTEECCREVLNYLCELLEESE